MHRFSASDAIDSRTASLLRDARTSTWEPAGYVRDMYQRRRSQQVTELAWSIASGSVYAEQTGLEVASRLLEETDDYATKLILATAVNDEAKHSYAFQEFALLAGGSVKPPSERTQELFDTLFGYENSTERFLAHTLMEGYAADEFIFFTAAFGAESLGDLYGLIRRDESRHVAMGMHRLCARDTQGTTQISLLPPERIDAVEKSCRELAAPTVIGDLVARLLPSKNADEVSAWISRRHATRVTALKASAFTAA